MTQEEYFKKIITVIIDLSINDDIYWVEENGVFRAGVLCGDLFEWGTADGERIEPEDINDLVKACKDCEEKGNRFWGPSLWCARKRGWRPQGACYKGIKPELWSLFDDCGGKREVNFCNPVEH